VLRVLCCVCRVACRSLAGRAQIRLDGLGAAPQLWPYGNGDTAITDDEEAAVKEGEEGEAALALRRKYMFEHKAHVFVVTAPPAYLSPTWDRALLRVLNKDKVMGDP
jgi:hypothetical protein